MPNDVEKLRVLLPHWIEHNAEHAAEFRAWAEKAKDAREDVLKAAGQLEAANETTVSKMAIFGALQLYLDFINLFLFLLRFLGERR